MKFQRGHLRSTRAFLTDFHLSLQRFVWVLKIIKRNLEKIRKITNEIKIKSFIEMKYEENEENRLGITGFLISCFREFQQFACRSIDYQLL
jgi:hypothetical protein